MTLKNHSIFILIATLPHMLAKLLFCDAFPSTPREVIFSSLVHLFPLLKHTPLYIISYVHSTFLSYKVMLCTYSAFTRSGAVLTLLC